MHDYTDPTPAHGTKRPNFNPHTVHRQHKLVLTLETTDSDHFHLFLSQLNTMIRNHTDLITHTTTEVTLNEELNERVTHLDTSLF